MTERNLTFPSARGHQMNAFLALPDSPQGDTPPETGAPAIIVLHEAFGLNDDIRRIARRFADNGYAAFAPDLLDIGGPRLLCIARTMRALSAGGGPALDDIESARAWLAARDGIDGERIGVAGFCLGGGFALLYAARGSMRAAAGFYGTVPAETDALEGICPVLAGYGAKDTRFLGMPGRLTRHLDKLDVPHDIEVYPNAGHSYMNQHSGVLAKIGGLGPLRKMAIGHHPESAEDSWRRMLAFFDTHVRN